MKLDKKSIDMLLGLSDEGLWHMIRMFAATSGVDLPLEAKSDDIVKLRAALSSLNDNDINRAMEILEVYRGKKK